MNYLVTGANGFIGRTLVKHLLDERHDVTAMSRSPGLLPGARYVQIDDYSDEKKMLKHLTRVDVIVHLAARAHQRDQNGENSFQEYAKANVTSTQSLARAGKMAGVKRFILISSIGVNGNATSNAAFSETDSPAPIEVYAKSKLAAEQLLISECGDLLPYVIIRPPLVYGPNAPGNFGRLLAALERGWPLPLGLVRNQRSFISVSNLVSFICLCGNHSAAENEIFLISDGDDISTPDLLRRLARAMGKSARLLPVPVSILRASARCFGASTAVERLCSDLRVDITKARLRLNWRPPLSLDEGLRLAVGT